MIERDFYCRGKVSVSDFYSEKDISHEFLIIATWNEKKKKKNLWQKEKQCSEMNF